MEQMVSDGLAQETNSAKDLYDDMVETKQTTKKYRAPKEKIAGVNVL